MDFPEVRFAFDESFVLIRRGKARWNQRCVIGREYANPQDRRIVRVRPVEEIVHQIRLLRIPMDVSRRLEEVGLSLNVPHLKTTGEEWSDPTKLVVEPLTIGTT